MSGHCGFYGILYDFEVPVAVELIAEGVFEGEDSGYHFIFAELKEERCLQLLRHIAGTDAVLIFSGLQHTMISADRHRKILLEETIKKQGMGARYIIAETSSLEKYLPTRLFYERTGTAKMPLCRLLQTGDGKSFM